MGWEESRLRQDLSPPFRFLSDFSNLARKGSEPACQLPTQLSSQLLDVIGTTNTILGVIRFNIQSHHSNLLHHTHFKLFDLTGSQLKTTT